MIQSQLIAPDSIVVVGASNNLSKPGGKLYHNIMCGTFQGDLYAVNPREDTIQGKPSFRLIRDLPETDLAILAIPAGLCLDAVRELAGKKRTRAFIIVSAGFAEENEQGAEIEREIVEVCRSHDASLIGPNCIGVMTPSYQGVFTLPIPKLDPGGCDFISGSGATAVFIMESGLQMGLRFNHVFSVGNSAQLGVEDVLQYLDETYLEGKSSRVKMLYFETIKDPGKLLRHAASLIRKGCRIAAVKAGSSEAGSRAASSHTGALATSDMAVDALFRKAGIVRCFGREELATVASVMLYPPLQGPRMALITHAGGPAVMLTDVLANGGMDVPKLQGPDVQRLLSHLFPGSSASNPIDMLATGNAEQLGIAIDFCESAFPEIDGIVVIFGTPGLTPVFDVYRVLHEKMTTCSKPVYPVLPSVVTASKEVEEFLARGHINFPDEVHLGHALVKVFRTPGPAFPEEPVFEPDRGVIREVIAASENGFLPPGAVRELLDAGGIPRVREEVSPDLSELKSKALEIGYPVVMKVVGPLHKSDVGGVVPGVESDVELERHFPRLMRVTGAEGVMVQPMLEGLELFAGARYEEKFGHVVLCGLGGIYVEALRDVATGLVPLSLQEALDMVRSLKGYRILEGIRGAEGVDVQQYAQLLAGLSRFLSHAPEIAEMDLNPIIGRGSQLRVVDARIRVEKPVV